MIIGEGSGYRLLLATVGCSVSVAVMAQAGVSARFADRMSAGSIASDARVIEAKPSNPAAEDSPRRDVSDRHSQVPGPEAPAFEPDIEPPAFTAPQTATAPLTNARSLLTYFRWLSEKEPSRGTLFTDLTANQDAIDVEQTPDPDGIAGLDFTTSSPAFFNAGPDIGFALGQETGLTIGADIGGTQRPDEQLDAPVFDAERYLLSIGITHRTEDDWTVNAGYQYGWLTDSSLSEDRSPSGQVSFSSSSSPESADADEAGIEPDAHTIAIGISRRF